jgi:superfamily II DNA or RNA helicase
MNKITHHGVYRIHKTKLFENVNSYTDLVKTIRKWGKNNPNENDPGYNKLVGMAYEVFFQFWGLTCGHNVGVSIKDIRDTNYDEFNRGDDFLHSNLFDEPGAIQVKFRSSGIYQFHNGALDGFLQKSRSVDRMCRPNNTILFISIDDHPKLFHYAYDNAIRKEIRIIDRKVQEYYINLEPDFWNRFRECIKESAKTVFKDDPELRDVQKTILYGNEYYKGTQEVINGLVEKGRVEASTATGKTLCIKKNIEDVFNTERKIVILTIPWRPLIGQTFTDYYTHKLFGWEDKQGVIHNQDKSSCVVVMSGDNLCYNDEIADVHQCLTPEVLEGKITSNLVKDKKTLIIITKDSYYKWYDKETNSGVFTNLIEKQLINKDYIFEIFDEYHNMIPITGDRDKHLLTANFLQTLSERNSGTIFYSASNKNGELVSSFNEKQFGPLLAKITRNDLRVRGYVCPSLQFRFISIKNIYASAEDRRQMENKGVDLNLSQIEAAGIITSYEDLVNNYYNQPNIMTFGSHVPGCAFITSDEGIKDKLQDVNLHFMCSDTPNTERAKIIDFIKKTGNNILNQHSVAGEGVNIPNLHSIVIHRGMSFKSLQQAIGRSDRALLEDTINFQKGLITLDNPIGWKKYWNVVYVIIDEEDNKNSERLIIELAKYLLNNGIPEDKWAFSAVEDERKVGVDIKMSKGANKDFEVNFDMHKLNNIINKAIIKAKEEVENELASLDDMCFKEIDVEKELANLEIEKWYNGLTTEELYQYAKNICENKNDNNNR